MNDLIRKITGRIKLLCNLREPPYELPADSWIDKASKDIVDIISNISQWIDVNEKLPDHMQTVLTITLKGGCCVSVFVDTDKMKETLRQRGFTEEKLAMDTSPYSFCSQEVRGNTLNGVTHWMHLPEMPK